MAAHEASSLNDKGDADQVSATVMDWSVPVLAVRRVARQKKVERYSTMIVPLASKPLPLSRSSGGHLPETGRDLLTHLRVNRS